jgi:hypothetical protein
VRPGGGKDEPVATAAAVDAPTPKIRM